MLALGLLLVAALLPAAGAARGGGGGGSGHCTSYAETTGKPHQGGYTEVTYYDCDNTAVGSTDCSSFGTYGSRSWVATPWTAGQKPDYNDDGIVCELAVIYRIP